MAFYEYLKNRRDELNLSNKKIATEIGISEQAVSKWFLGKSVPDIMLFPKVAEILKIDPISLVKELWGSDKEYSSHIANSTFVFLSPLNTTSLFSSYPIRQLKGKTFQVNCSEAVFDSVMESSGEEYGIVVLSPISKRDKIINYKLTGWKNYYKTDLFEFFLENCFKSYNSSLYASNGAKKSDLEVVKTVIFSKYKKIVTYNRICSMLSGSKKEFDNDHRIICTELAEAEKDVIESSLFSNILRYNEKMRYYNAQYTVNYMLYKALDYEMISTECQDYFLHFIIRADVIKKSGIRLDTYDNYLKIQNILSKNAETDTTLYVWTYNRSIVDKKRNVLNYPDYSEYECYINTLSEEELQKEFYICINLKKRIDLELKNTRRSIRNFIDFNFYTEANDDQSFNRKNNITYNNIFEYLIRENELLNNDTSNRCSILLKNKLRELYDNYVKHSSNINQLRLYYDNSEPEYYSKPDNIKNEIYDLCNKMCDFSGGSDGNYIALKNIVNNLGAHVCSWYYHLYGEVLESAQAVKSEFAKKLLIEYKDNGKISYSDTVTVIKEELASILEQKEFAPVISSGVTSIADSEFYENENITCIDIPDSVTSIGICAFYKCRNLNSISIPDSVKAIGSKAFYGCVNLKSIKIPDGIKIIDDSVLSGCSSLVSAKIPQSVVIIKDNAFSDCNNLVSIDIPESVSIVGYYAFSNCGNLRSITVSSGITSIDGSAFFGCNNLSSINTRENRQYISIDGVLFSKDGLTLIAYPNAKSNEYTVPDGVKEIGCFAFAGCNNLKKVIIPKSVRTIGDEAFKDCSALSKINIPESITEIGCETFSGCCNLSSIKISGKIKEIKIGTFKGCRSLKSVNLPYGITVIDEYAFNGCNNLKEIAVPSSVKIMKNAFSSDCNIQKI